MVIARVTLASGFGPANVSLLSISNQSDPGQYPGRLPYRTAAAQPPGTKLTFRICVADHFQVLAKIRPSMVYSFC